jgi:hypothetical protein
VPREETDDPSLAAMAEYLIMHGFKVEASRLVSPFNLQGSAV